MISRRASALLATAAATSLLLVGCSGGDNNKKDDDQDNGRLSFSKLLGNEDQDWTTLEERLQEELAKCMTEQGWEYTPVKYPEQNFEYSDENYLEEIKVRGMGIAYYTLYPDGGSELGIDDPWESWEDPNSKYVEGLTEAEQIAYYETMYGTQEEQEALSREETDPETGETWTTMYGNAGCYGVAEKAVGINNDDSMAKYEAIEQFQTEFYERMEADPRIVALQEKLLKCMRDRGFDFQSKDDLYMASYEQFQTRHDEIVPDRWKDPFENWTEQQINEFYENATEQQINELFAPEPLTDEQRTALEQLLKDEIDFAVAQHECTSPLNEEAQKIHQDLEDEYLRENEAAIRAALANVSGDK